MTYPGALDHVSSRDQICLPILLRYKIACFIESASVVYLYHGPLRIRHEVLSMISVFPFVIFVGH
jgi:hypothetical protein